MKEVILKCPECSHKQKAYQLDTSQTAIKCVQCGTEMKPICDKDQEGSRPCPSCGNICGSDDVLCIKCGYNFKTGKQLSGAETSVKIKEKRKSNMGGLIKLLFVIALLAAIWYFGINKLIIALKVHKSNYAFEELRYDQAVNELKIPSIVGSKENKQFVELRKKQIALEKENNQKNKSIISDTITFRLRESITAPIDLMYLHFEIRNKGETPMIVDQRNFYLKSLSGKPNLALCRLKNPEVNFTQQVLAPGEILKAAICVKYLPAVRLDPEAGKDELLYLIFNNGDVYLQQKINPMSIWVLTSKDELEKYKAEKGK